MPSNSESSSTAASSWEAKAQRHLRRNFTVGVTFNTLKTFFDPVLDLNTTIPTFVNNLSKSNWVVGAIVAEQRIFTNLIQVFFANFLETRPRKKYLFITSEYVMATSALLISLVVFALGERKPLAALISFAVAIAFAQAAMGFSFVAMQDILGKMIPATLRGSYTGTIGLLVRILTIASGFVIAYFIAHWKFPTNFGLLFLCLGLTHVVATSIFLFIREPQAPVRRHKVKTFRFLADAAGILKSDPSYKRYMLMRVFMSIGAMAYPFYMTYGLKVLDIPQRYSGIYFSVGQIVAMTWVFLAGFIGNKRGFKILLQVSSFCLVLHPISALSALPLSSFLHEVMPSISNQRILEIIYVLPFVFLRIGVGSNELALFNYLLEIAPAEQRPTYVGLANTLVAPLAITNLLGGIIIDKTSYSTLFLICFSLGLVAFVFACGLVNPRKRTKPH